MCIGRGPAWEADDHGYKSNEIIARRQSDKAVELWEDGKATAITGSWMPSCQPVPSGFSAPVIAVLMLLCVSRRSMNHTGPQALSRLSAS